MRAQGKSPKPKGSASPRWTGGKSSAWKRWQEKHPGRRATHFPANMAVAKAVRAGLLIRPTSCEQCGASGVRIEGAHSDYRRPLDVRWLCKPCHSRWDRAVPKTGKHARRIVIKCYAGSVPPVDEAVEAYRRALLMSQQAIAEGWEQTVEVLQREREAVKV